MSTPNQPPLTPPGSAPTRPRRGWQIVLAISLALNLLVAGVVAGGVLRMHRLDPGATQTRGTAQAPGDMRALWRALPPEVRAALRTREAPRLSRAERHARNAVHGQRMAALLLADPFDPDAFVAAMDAHRSALDAERHAVQTALAAQIAALSSEERATLARALRHDEDDDDD